MQDYVIAEAFHRLANIDLILLMILIVQVMSLIHSKLRCGVFDHRYPISLILKAVNLGVDTDTIGCLAGGLAGSWYGGRVIPQTWLKSVLNRDKIVELSTCLIKSQQRTNKLSSEFSFDLGSFNFVTTINILYYNFGS